MLINKHEGNREVLHQDLFLLFMIKLHGYLLQGLKRTNKVIK